jgi:hypothetical protein
MWDDTWTGVEAWKDDGGTIILFLVLLYEIRGLNTLDRGTFRSQMSHEQDPHEQ